ncbi:TIM barrel protein [Betaproteobacteria bacterium LSUCC0117]|nr:TIM barrel protein [Betaproteobacteria bacterium LSUCC0117]
MKRVFISTGGFHNKTGYEAAKYLLAHDIDSIELSGGMYSKAVEDELIILNDIANIQIHNYFPTPAYPFVINIASANPSLRSKSIAHIKNAIVHASKIKNMRYSFHAGFRVDPTIQEIGGRPTYSKMVNKANALAIFQDSVLEITEHADKLGVEILIENNVCNQKALDIFGEVPYLLCAPDEIESFFADSRNKKVSLLMDVAHLKVSSTVLNFPKQEALENLSNTISAYHFSDNDGTEDSNNAFSMDSWFCPYIKSSCDFVTIEVYTEEVEILKEQMVIADRILHG